MVINRSANADGYFLATYSRLVSGALIMVLANISKQGVQIEVSSTFACPKCVTKYYLLIKINPMYLQILLF